MTQKLSNSAVKKFKFLPTVQVSTKDKMHFFCIFSILLDQTKPIKIYQGQCQQSRTIFISFFPQWQIQKVYLAQQDFKILSQPPNLNLMNREGTAAFIHFLLQNLESQIRFYVLWPTMTEEHFRLLAVLAFYCPLVFLIAPHWTKSWLLVLYL